MNTKEKILESALMLFAEKGYDGTSVEEIAKSVGIKAPSLYKHYKGKEDILNALIDAAESSYEVFFGSEKNVGNIPGSREEFVCNTLDKIKFTMSDPLICKVRKFLVQEQFRNERLATITTRHQINGIQHMYMKIIAEMMEAGLVVEDDPALLSIELTSPAALLISQADRQPEEKDHILKIIEKHLQHFCSVYMRE